MNRSTELDSLRGLLLVLMTLTHLPTRLSAYSHDFFGFVSAAEGFVFLSAFLASVIHTRRARRDGWPAVRRHLHERSLKLYAYHVLLLGLALVLATVFDDRPAITNVLAFYFDQPSKALLASPLLIYCPPLFDILPMYVVFLAITPALLELGHRRGFGVLLAASMLIWVIGQLGARAHVLSLLDWLLDIPTSAMGAFDLFGWQLLWTLGLILGAAPSLRDAVSRPPRPWVGLALGLAIGFFVLRHVDRMFELGLGNTFLLNKWRFAPLRIVNLASLAVLASHFGPRVVRWARLRVLERLGRASLRVFCAHIVLCLVAFLIVGDVDQDIPLWIDLGLVAATFGALSLIAGGHRAPPAVLPPAAS